MANTRIKDLNNTATTVPSDAYVAIDGSANGTAKISRDNLRQDTADAIAAAPSTYNLAPLTSGSVDVDKGGTGSTTVDGAKTTLQIPNVGTAANEVPTNGQLGNMSFQNSEAVTVDDLTIDGELTAAVGKPMPVNGPTMRFDGSNDFVDFAYSASHSFTNAGGDTAFSGGGWVKKHANDQVYLISKRDDSLREYIFQVSATGQIYLELFDSSNNTAYAYTAAGTVNDYEWTHVAFTFSASSAVGLAANDITIYTNGAAQPVTAYNAGGYTGMTDNSKPVWVQKAGSSIFGAGEIRDVKLFNKELSAAEIREVYSNGQLPESFAESTGTADVVTDGGFENWNTSTDLTNWSDGSAVSVAQSTDKISGTYSCKITGGGDIGSSGNNWLLQNTVIYNANKKYRLTGKVKRFSGSTNALQFGALYYQIIQFNGTTFSPASTSTQLPFIGAVTSKDLGNDWYSFSVDFTTTVATTLTIGVNGSTDPYLVDDVSLVQIGSVLDARAEQFDTSTGKLYDLSGNSFVGTQSGGVSVLGREFLIPERGIFTPTIYYQNPTGLSTSYTTQSGNYVRTGDLVSIQIKLTWTVTGTPVNDNLGVRGIPFQPAREDSLACHDSQGQTALVTTNASNDIMYCLSNSLASNLADNVGAGTHTIYISGTYQIQ